MVLNSKILGIVTFSISSFFSFISSTLPRRRRECSRPCGFFSM